jgi:hypothetical protein
MQKFRRKPYDIEAFWIHPDYFKKQDDWPRWMIDAWNKVGNIPGKLYDSNWFLPDRNHHLEDGPCCLVIAENDSVLVKWYTWLVREEDGSLKNYTEHELYTLFEPIP